MKCAMVIALDMKFNTWFLISFFAEIYISLSRYTNFFTDISSSSFNKNIDFSCFIVIQKILFVGTCDF